MEVKKLKMKMCDDHRTRLREAIEYRGMKPLISKNGSALIARMSDIKASLLNPTADSFDPFVRALLEISLTFIGNAHEEYQTDGCCPLCVVRDRGTIQNNDEDWINGCCDEQLQMARQLNLVPPEA